MSLSHSAPNVGAPFHDFVTFDNSVATNEYTVADKGKKVIFRSAYGFFIKTDVYAYPQHQNFMNDVLLVGYFIEDIILTQHVNPILRAVAEDVVSDLHKLAVSLLDVTNLKIAEHHAVIINQIMLIKNKLKQLRPKIYGVNSDYIFMNGEIKDVVGFYCTNPGYTDNLAESLVMMFNNLYEQFREIDCAARLRNQIPPSNPQLPSLEIPTLELSKIEEIRPDVCSTITSTYLTRICRMICGPFSYVDFIDYISRGYDNGLLDRHKPITRNELPSYIYKFLVNAMLKEEEFRMMSINKNRRVWEFASQFPSNYLPSIRLWDQIARDARGRIEFGEELQKRALAKQITKKNIIVKPKLHQFRGGNGMADYFVLASIAVCLGVLVFVVYVAYYVAVENYTPPCTSRRKNKTYMH